MLLRRSASDRRHTRLGLLSSEDLTGRASGLALAPVFECAWAGEAGADWAAFLFRRPQPAWASLRRRLYGKSLGLVRLPPSLRASVLRGCEAFCDLNAICHSHHACWSPGVAWIDCGRSTQQASSRNGFTGRPSLRAAPAVFFKGCPSVLGAVVSAAEGEDAVEGLLLCCLKSLNLRSRSKV